MSQKHELLAGVEQRETNLHVVYVICDQIQVYRIWMYWTVFGYQKSGDVCHNITVLKYFSEILYDCWVSQRPIYIDRLVCCTSLSMKFPTIWKPSIGDICLVYCSITLNVNSVGFLLRNTNQIFTKPDDRNNKGNSHQIRLIQKSRKTLFCPYLFTHFTNPSYILHFSDVIVGAVGSQITSFAIVYSTVYSGADQRKLQSSASLAFVRGIHRWPVNSPHKGPVTRKMFPFDDVIMIEQGSHTDVLCTKFRLKWML